MASGSGKYKGTNRRRAEGLTPNSGGRRRKPNTAAFNPNETPF